MILGARIKAARNSARLTQKELAKKLGTDHTTISKWESGVNEPDSKTIVQIADICSVTTDYLLGKTDTYSHQGYDDIDKALNDPELGLWFKDIQDASPEKREELRQFWEFIQQREKGRKPGDKQR